ncbi:MAG: hypothetical protein J7L40_03875 [Candidatus Marinimicrobia bacterium]|nr:hypothetical protein [Candidatus Neomarinimicrobiota bacterium]
MRKAFPRMLAAGEFGVSLEINMSKDVLYYPTIEFYDETWLKASLCVWDKIYRIVPSSYDPKDSDEVKIAIDNGLVENISLSKADLSQTAEMFEAYLENTEI